MGERRYERPAQHATAARVRRPGPGLEVLAASGNREAAVRLFLVEQVGLCDVAVEQLSSSPAWPQMVALAHTGHTIPLSPARPNFPSSFRCASGTHARAPRNDELPLDTR